MNNIKFLWFLIALLFLTVAFFALNYFGLSAMNPLGAKGYYAVYLTSGDVYFGELSEFSNTTLSNVYFLVKGKDRSGADAFALQRLTDAVWGPEDKLYLNAENILWKTKLRNDGAAMKAISGGNSMSVPVPAEEVMKEVTPQNEATTTDF